MRRTSWILGIAVLLLLAACAPGNEYAAHEAGNPGFWRGLWHGLISPITFIISLFSDEVGIYAARNTGAWYDAGFMIGVSAVFSGSGSGRPPARVEGGGSGSEGLRTATTTRRSVAEDTRFELVRA